MASNFAIPLQTMGAFSFYNYKILISLLTRNYHVNKEIIKRRSNTVMIGFVFIREDTNLSLAKNILKKKKYRAYHKPLFRKKKLEIIGTKKLKLIYKYR